MQLLTLAMKDVKMRPEKVQIVGPNLSTITPYYLIFIKIGISVFQKDLKKRFLNHFW